MPDLSSRKKTLVRLLLGASLLAPGAPVAWAEPPPSTDAASPLPGAHQRARHKTSVKARHVPPSERLPEEPNQVKEQVAPVPGPPIPPGSSADAPKR